jgi:hypothetical protein
VPDATGPHVPSVPCPFLALEQASQVPVQAVSQQTPSTQFPVAQSASAEQAAPWGFWPERMRLRTRTAPQGEVGSMRSYETITDWAGPAAIAGLCEA